MAFPLRLTSKVSLLKDFQFALVASMTFKQCCFACTKMQLLEME